MNNKNWTGNSNSIYKTLGASNHTKEEREKNDFYATDPIATEHLVYLEDINKNVLDPCVGEGHLIQELVERGHDLTVMDIIDRGYPNTKIQNFLEWKGEFDGDIIMNPPYKYAKQFVEKSLEVISEGNKVYAFLKVQFLESVGRREIFKKTPPKTVYVSSSRITCAKNADFEKMKQSGGSAACYCWYVWEKGYKGSTTLKWFN